MNLIVRTKILKDSRDGAPVRVTFKVWRNGVCIGTFMYESEAHALAKAVVDELMRTAEQEKDGDGWTAEKRDLNDCEWPDLVEVGAIYAVVRDDGEVGQGYDDEEDAKQALAELGVAVDRPSP